MQCEDYLLLISGHIDKMNTEAEEAALQAHLEACAECRAVLAQMEAADTALSAARVEPPADLTKRILSGVKKSRRIPRKFYALTAASLAAAAMLGIFVGGKLPVYQPKKDAEANLQSDNSAKSAAPSESECDPAYAESEQFSINGFIPDFISPAGAANSDYAEPFRTTGSDASVLLLWDAEPTDFYQLADLESTELPADIAADESALQSSFSSILFSLESEDDSILTTYCVSTDVFFSLLAANTGTCELSLYAPDTVTETCYVVVVTYTNGATAQSDE